MKKLLSMLMALLLCVGMTINVNAVAKVRIANSFVYTGASQYIEFKDNRLVEDEAKVVSVKSSKKSVLKVVGKKGKLISDIYFKGVKAGSAKITLKYKYEKKSYTVTKTIKVKKYPNAIKKIVLNGKAINLKSNKVEYYDDDYDKDKVKVKVTASKGWKVSKMTYNVNYAGAKKMKNGGTVSFDEDLMEIKITMKKSKQTFVYVITLIDIEA